MSQQFATLDGTTYLLPQRGYTDAQRELLRKLVERSEAGLSAGYVSVVEYGAGQGGNDIDAINDAVAAAVAGGTRRIHFPAGEYIMDGEDETDAFSAVTIPSDFAVTGEGDGKSIIWMKGIAESEQVYNGDGITCFETVGGTHRVVYDGLHFKGENGVGAAGFTYVFNQQTACILSSYSGTLSSDITVQNCAFDNLYGFSFHDPSSENVSINALNNVFRYCANGLNVNSEGSIQAGNKFFNSEGIESSGAHTIIANNYFKDSYLQSISAGGTGDARPGVIVIGNIIDGAQTLDEALGGGILIGEGFCFGVVSGNTVSGCYYGVQNGSGEFEAPSGDNLITGNRITDCHIGIVLAYGADRVTVSGNTATDGAIGMSANAVDDCVIVGNVLDGTVQDLTVAACDNLRLDPSNHYLTNNVYLPPGSTFATLKRPVAASTDIVEYIKLHTGSGSPDYGYFKRFASGKMQWGNQDDVFDTTLERASAGVLKTTGKVTATAGLGVGNSAAAGTPGTVVKKVEIFDAAGTSLGFIAVYDAIT